tara:strand:+ start:9727 stop:10023 length:297 start_codon:yes stop_codon:yes gene_type:complete
MQIASIDVTKFNKDEFFHGKKGVYTDLLYIENRDGIDEYGNMGMVVQGLSKAKRQADPTARGVIIGNYKDTNIRLEDNPQQGNQAPPAPTGDDDDIPF